MARYDKDPLGGQVDYSQYKSWPPVIDPSTGGIIGYQVPGFPQYLYDEVSSNATGRKVLRTNPKGAIEEQQKAQDLQNKAIEQQQFNQSPLGQILPVGASVGGMILANQLMTPSVDPVQQVLAKQLEQQALQQGAQQAGQQGASSLANSAAQGASNIPSAPSNVTMGAPTPTGAELATSMGPTPFYVPAAIAAGTYLAGKSAYDQLKGNPEDKSASGKFGRGQLAFTTMGLSEVARGLGIGGQKSTRQEAADKTKDLLKQSDNPNYQSYVQGMREQYKSAPTGKAYAGKYDTWSEYEKAGLEAADLTGVYGNIKTYGEEWANLTEPQRQAITQANIDSGLYKSKKGDVEITDKNKAIENKNNVLKGFQVGAQAAPVAANPLAQAAAQGAAIPRPVAQTSGFVRR